MDGYNDSEYQGYDPGFVSADIAAANEQFQQINPGQTPSEVRIDDPPLPYLSNDPKWTMVPTAMRCVTGYELNSLIDDISRTNSLHSDEISHTRDLLAKTVGRVDEMARKIEKLGNDLSKIKEWVTAVDEFLNHMRSEIGELTARIDPDWITSSPAHPTLRQGFQRQGAR